MESSVWKVFIIIYTVTVYIFIFLSVHSLSRGMVLPKTAYLVSQAECSFNVSLPRNVRTVCCKTGPTNPFYRRPLKNLKNANGLAWGQFSWLQNYHFTAGWGVVITFFQTPLSLLPGFKRGDMPCLWKSKLFDGRTFSHSRGPSSYPVDFYIYIVLSLPTVLLCSKFFSLVFQICHRNWNSFLVICTCKNYSYICLL